VAINHPGWSTTDFRQFFERISDKQAILPALEALKIVWPKANLDLYPPPQSAFIAEDGSGDGAKAKVVPVAILPNLSPGLRDRKCGEETSRLAC
jgi:hypothetical protein